MKKYEREKPLTIPPFHYVRKQKADALKSFLDDGYEHDVEVSINGCLTFVVRAVLKINDQHETCVVLVIEMTSF